MLLLRDAQPGDLDGLLSLARVLNSVNLPNDRRALSAITRKSPCTFFEVAEREHYSSTLDMHFRHRVLSLGYHFDGPTEIGGLVVHPRNRGGDARPGKQLLFVRFLYLAAF